MKLSPIGVEMLVKREGMPLGAYNDSQGFCTVGIGHLLHRSRCTNEDFKRWAGMTRQQAVELFEQDIAEIYGKAVNDFVKVPLADHQFDALVSLCFNIGVNGFKSSTVVKRLNARDYEGAATAFMMWNKPSAIVGRRRGEMNQFRTPYGNQLPPPSVSLTFTSVPQTQERVELLRGVSAKFAKADWLHPVFRLRLEALYNEVPFTNKSGGRPRQRQAELYRLFKSGRGNPANPPGTSWHEYDEDGSTLAQAADIHPVKASFATLHAAAKRHGIHFPVAKEGWHAQPIEAKSSRRTAGQGLGPVLAYWNPEAEEDDEMLEVVFIEGDPNLYMRDGGLVWPLTDPKGIEQLRESGLCMPKDRKLRPQEFSQLKRL